MKKLQVLLFLGLSNFLFSQIVCEKLSSEMNYQTKEQVEKINEFCVDKANKNIIYNKVPYKILDIEKDDRDISFVTAKNINEKKVIFVVDKTFVIIYSKDLDLDLIISKPLK